MNLQFSVTRNWAYPAFLCAVRNFSCDRLLHNPGRFRAIQDNPGQFSQDAGHSRQKHPENPLLDLSPFSFRTERQEPVARMGR